MLELSIIYLKIHNANAEENLNFNHCLRSSTWKRLTNNLPEIYHRFTKNKAIFGVLPSKNLPKIYQKFTRNLPEIYQWFTESTGNLPKAHRKHFLIYQKFTNGLPKMFGQKYFDISIMYFLKKYFDFLKNILLQSISTASFDENSRFDCS